MNDTFSHESEGYVCPFCTVLTNGHDRYTNEQDVVYKNEDVTAFVAPKWWANNKGHVLILPNKHYENIYDIPDDLHAEVYRVVKKIAIAIRSTYECEGTSIRQHNEPAGNQDIWHFHVHVYPRYSEDKLYHNHDNTAFSDPALRLPYAEKLRAYFDEND